ncbi:origin recognition complex subunit 5 family protein [Acanthamoeba castellanii str. Neff]|uniref:Origin recognition complex subunit 5 family protein n=1 Tax=Acanthamoeba castellanii (strain ATCC 30010 / Neff) TaxID=1257118 RepID=L8H8U6_ACACF|nr:origin recognition complex subunit 5 family protein [Acanthamoeba castellanii str. Neff]ELR21580.1 origin recognition complex subunit 5 family protein [Acanthamoeba castellanii str. Neff]
MEPRNVEGGKDPQDAYDDLVNVVEQKLTRTFVGRDQQIRTLIRLLGQREDRVGSLMVYGPPASGKTAVVRAVACGLRLPHALVDCSAQHVAHSLLFEDILARLQPHVPALSISCASPAKFVSALRVVCAGRAETTYIILDKAERLRETSGALLQLLLRLDEVTGCNIGVILISSIVWDKFLTKNGLREPIPILFPRYSRSELIAICSRDCPEDNRDLFEGIVMVVIDYVAKACTDLTEVRRIVLHFLNKFNDPLLTAGLGTENGRVLQKLKPHLGQVWQKLFAGLPTEDEDERLDFELAGYAKYLVLAGYLASYNDPRFDVDHFSAKTVGQAKKGGGRTFAQLKEDPNLRLLGPRDFSLDRLLAIFSAIADRVGDVDTGNHNIYHQVSTLVSLGFFIRVSTEENLDTMRLKCNMSHEFINNLAANLSFDLSNGLVPASASFSAMVFCCITIMLIACVPVCTRVSTPRQ